ncbi:LysE family translocator [Streptomyces canus]|uniref:LysE family translocator n=1 Tax=Streptomyces canus TaxID=58343 RepID=UPI00340218B2
MPTEVLPFLLAVAVLTVTPGPDMALVLRNGARGGAHGAWWTGLGCCAGVAVHAAAAVVGLSALLAASAAAFTVVKLVGAGYLIYLGLTALWHSRRGIPRDVEQASVARAPVERRAAFKQGMWSNLLNPKIALIFLTLLPQFVAEGEPRFRTTAELALIFLAWAVLWWRLFSLLIAGLGTFLSKTRVQTAFEKVTGTVLIALGLRVAME